MKLAEQETTNLELDIQNIPIERDWMTTFAGFFWGEGCFQIEVQHNGKSFNPHCQMQLRADDGWILRNFAQRLGGQLTWVDGGGENPKVHWRVNAMEDCMRIARILESCPSLPFSKRRSVALLA